jgi:hypothetical protein
VFARGVAANILGQDIWTGCENKGCRTHPAAGRWYTDGCQHQISHNSALHWHNLTKKSNTPLIDQAASTMCSGNSKNPTILFKK